MDRRSFLAALAAFVSAAPAAAAPRQVPVPVVTIYPGDTIRQSQIAERDMPADMPTPEAFVDSPAMAIGKVARRTLLPGKPIPASALMEPLAVKVGGQVRLIFNEDGMIITASGMALQSGAIGDFVRVRNLDSGIVVSGTILPDGSVRVSGT